MADGPARILVVTGGHRFDRAALGALWDDIGVAWDEARQPDARARLTPEGAAGHDVIVFHDIPGIRFHRDAPPDLLPPSDDLRAGFARLVASGKPMLFLHHAIAGWPCWDGYARVIGARFFYEPGHYDSVSYPASGYRAGVQYAARPIGTHPVTEGLDDGFSLTDELYLFQLLEADIVPLMRAEHDFSDNFQCAAAALRGQGRPAVAPPRPCDLIAWARAAGPSPVVVIQPGDGPETFANAGFRRLVGNALRWLAAPDAARWAARRHERKRHDA